MVGGGQLVCACNRKEKGESDTHAIYFSEGKSPGSGLWSGFWGEYGSKQERVLEKSVEK